MSDYLATPVGGGPWPGVLVVHDALGLGDDVKEQADWLSAAGYLASVPDMYGGRFPLRCIKGAMAQLHARQGPIFDQLDAARTVLAEHPSCTGTVGVIGYCMGGGFALLLAARPGYAAASVNYGEVPDDAAELLAGACPILGSYGGRDRSLPGAADRLRAAVPSAEVKEYPEARHGFINRLAAASPLVPMMKVTGVGYDHDAAADAKRRILTFFGTHLR
jgi:carboxymethylenebutenolidase